MKSIQGTLIVAVAVLAIAGCAPGPAPTTSDSPSATPDPTESVSAPAVPADCAAIEGAVSFPADFAGEERPWDPATPTPGWPSDTVADLQCSWFVSGSDTTSLAVQYGTSTSDPDSAVAALIADGFTCGGDAESGTMCEKTAPNPFFPTDTVVQLHVRAGTWIAVAWSNDAVFNAGLITELAAA